MSDDETPFTTRETFASQQELCDRVAKHLARKIKEQFEELLRAGTTLGNVTTKITPPPGVTWERLLQDILSAMTGEEWLVTKNHPRHTCHRIKAIESFLGNYDRYVFICHPDFAVEAICAMTKNTPAPTDWLDRKGERDANHGLDMYLDPDSKIT